MWSISIPSMEFDSFITTAQSYTALRQTGLLACAVSTAVHEATGACHGAKGSSQGEPQPGLWGRSYLCQGNLWRKCKCLDRAWVAQGWELPSSLTIRLAFHSSPWAVPPISPISHPPAFPPPSRSPHSVRTQPVQGWLTWAAPQHGWVGTSPCPNPALLAYGMFATTLCRHKRDVSAQGCNWTS